MKFNDQTTGIIKQLFTSMHEGFILFEIMRDPKGSPVDYRFIDLNPAAEMLIDLKSSEVINNTLSEMIPRSASSLMQAYNEVVRGNQTMEFEYYFQRTDLFYKILCLADPGRNQLAVLFTDVTSLKKAESASSEYQQRFRKSFDNSDFGMALISPEGRYLKVNAAFCGILEYSEEEFLTLSVQDITHPEDYENDLLLGKALVNNEMEIYSTEKRYRHKKGFWVWVSLNLSAVRDQEGAVKYFISQVQDITRRKQQEEELNKQLYFLTALNNLSKAITLKQDLKSILRVTMQYLKESFSSDFGTALVLDEDKERFIITSPYSKEPSEDGITGLIEGAERTYSELNFTKKLVPNRINVLYLDEFDEESLSEEAVQRIKKIMGLGIKSIIVIPLESRNRIYTFIMMKFRENGSLTQNERIFLNGVIDHLGIAANNNRLYNELAQSYQDLKVAQKKALERARLNAMGQMASGIAHDINNTLSPIRLYTDALIDGAEELSGRARRFLTTIRAACGDIENTIARLRMFYREPGEEEMKQKPFDLSQLLEEVQDLARPRWQDMPQKNGNLIEFATEIPRGSIMFTGVESEIREALVNLVFNAVDAMPSGGRIGLRVLKVDHSIVVEVEDTGTGMSEEQKQRCLEPFYTTKGQRGTGLGLSSCIRNG